MNNKIYRVSVEITEDHLQNFINIIKNILPKVIKNPIEKISFYNISVNPVRTLGYEIIMARGENDTIYLGISNSYFAAKELAEITYDNQKGNLALIDIFLSLKDKKIMIYPVILDYSATTHPEESSLYNYIKQIIENEIKKIVPDINFYDITSKNICNHFCWKEKQCKYFLKNCLKNTPIYEKAVICEIIDIFNNHISKFEKYKKIIPPWYRNEDGTIDSINYISFATIIDIISRKN